MTRRKMLHGMYRPSSKPPQTPWARHLDAVRRERDWSAQQMFEFVQEPLGLSPKTRAAFLPLLADSEPNERQAAVLTRLFGEPPAIPLPVPPDEPPGLASALLALADELRAAREGREAAEARAQLAEDRLTAQGRAIEEMARRLAVLEGAASHVRSIPRG